MYFFPQDADYSQHDGVFIRTTFPWILRPSSEFQFVWESFYVVLVSLVAVFYPWQTMRNAKSGKMSYIFMCFVCFTYTVDYIMRTCTAVEDDKGIPVIRKAIYYAVLLFSLIRLNFCFRCLHEIFGFSGE